MTNEAWNKKGPQCTVCNAVSSFRWEGEHLVLEPGWLLRIGADGLLGPYCPEHASYGKPYLCECCSKKVGKA